MSRAEDQITQYLYQGESIRSAFDVGPVRVVLTSHRVFASLPDGGIERAELPNVTGVTRKTRGSLSGVVWGVSLTIIGVAFLAVGLSVRTSEAFNTPEFREDAAASAGAGALTDLVGLVLWAVENLDLLLLGLGGVCLLFAAIPIVNYWFRVRERSLAIQLAGDRPDIHLPLEYISVEDEFRLEKALVPEQVSDDIPADVDIDDIPADIDESPDPGARGGEDSGTGETAGNDGGPTTGTGGGDPSAVGDGPTTGTGGDVSAGADADTDSRSREGSAATADDDTHEFEWVGTETANGQAEDSTTGDRE
jgi:hypothetical protein